MHRKILINDIRVRGIGKSDIIEDPILSQSKEPLKVEKVRFQMYNAEKTDFN